MGFHCHAGGGCEPARRGGVCRPGRQLAEARPRRPSSSAAAPSGSTSRVATSTTSTRRSRTGRARGRCSFRRPSSCSTIPTRRSRAVAGSPSDGASKYTVSRDGKTYTFTIRSGHRFSDGRRVTAANYAYAINRALDKELQSPAFQFVSDPSGANIVGAQAVRDGRAAKASGVRVSGNRLIIRLTKVGPDVPGEDLDAVLPGHVDAASARQGGHLGQRQPAAVGRPVLRLARVSRTGASCSAGIRATAASGSRNPDAINFTVGVNIESGYRQVLAGQVDYQEGIPTTEYADLARRFGVNKGQFRVAPSNCTSYIALNTKNDLFRNNVWPAEGRQLRDQPERDGSAGRPVRRPGARPDPPAGLPGLQERQHLPGTAEPRTGPHARPRQGAVGDARVLLRAHPARPAADGARPGQPEPDRHQHRASRLPWVRDLRRCRAPARPITTSRPAAGARTTRIRTTS